MFIQSVLIASLLGIVGTASANSCSNVYVMGTFDESGLRESEHGIYATGTFRVAEEEDESKQPDFNLTEIDCEKQPDDVAFKCKVTIASVGASSGKPDTDDPNCSLDLSSSTYSMKELQKGILTGAGTSGVCYNTILTIDRDSKWVYLSFTRTKFADNYDKTKSGTCGHPRTEVLMNCTGWPRIRKDLQTPSRYCDFSSSSDK